MDINDIIGAIVGLLTGLGALLLGFKILSDNIEKLANTGLKKLFNKTSNNRFIGIAIGLVATAIVQSSGATTVMIVGFVNAGIMTLFQATAMIMGANIGTTVTAQIAALGDTNIGQYLLLLTFIGIIGYLICKKDRTKTIFMAITGLGIVFVALNLMSTSMGIFSTSQEIQDAFELINNPFLLFLIGIVITAALQSSSAVTSILISMASAGLLIGGGGNSILYIILGSNIGSCATALLSIFGATTNAKRASIIHLLFNTFGSIVFFIILLIFPQFNEVTFETWFKGLPGTQIAMFHTFFNVICTLLFMPFINVFVTLAKLIIRDKIVEERVSHLDERFLKTPSIAIDQASKETLILGQLAMETLNISIEAFIQKDTDKKTLIGKNIDEIETINNNILNYLLKITSLGSFITKDDELYISGLHKILIDFSRQAEIADNMMKYTISQVEKNLEFSSSVIEGIKIVQDKLNQQFTLSSKLFNEMNKTILEESDLIEKDIDKLRSELINGHIKRLEEGKCSPSSNTIFINLVSNLERAGDHLNYAAHTLFEITKM